MIIMKSAILKTVIKWPNNGIITSIMDRIIQHFKMF